MANYTDTVIVIRNLQNNPFLLARIKRGDFGKQFVTDGCTAEILHQTEYCLPGKVLDALVAAKIDFDAYSYDISTGAGYHFAAEHGEVKRTSFCADQYDQEALKKTQINEPEFFQIFQLEDYLEAASA